MSLAILSKRRLVGCRIQHIKKGNIMYASNSVGYFLHATNLRADWPKMQDDSFDFAVRLAAVVGNTLTSKPPEGQPQKDQYFVPFAAMRREATRKVMQDITLMGPKLMDFMNVITEVSGLAVVHTNDGLWFFDLRGRLPTSGTLNHLQFTEKFKRVQDSAQVEQFSPEDDADEDQDW